MSVIDAVYRWASEWKTWIRDQYVDKRDQVRAVSDARAFRTANGISARTEAKPAHGQRHVYEVHYAVGTRFYVYRFHRTHGPHALIRVTWTSGDTHEEMDVTEDLRAYLGPNQDMHGTRDLRASNYGYHGKGSLTFYYHHITVSFAHDENVDLVDIVRSSDRWIKLHPDRALSTNVLEVSDVATTSSSEFGTDHSECGHDRISCYVPGRLRRSKSCDDLTRMVSSDAQ